MKSQSKEIKRGVILILIREWNKVYRSEKSLVLSALITILLNSKSEHPRSRSSWWRLMSSDERVSRSLTSPTKITSSTMRETNDASRCWASNSYSSSQSLTSQSDGLSLWEAYSGAIDTTEREIFWTRCTGRRWCRCSRSSIFGKLALNSDRLSYSFQQLMPDYSYRKAKS